jgi:hypothetical protein
VKTFTLNPKKQSIVLDNIKVKRYEAIGSYLQSSTSFLPKKFACLVVWHVHQWHHSHHQLCGNIEYADNHEGNVDDRDASEDIQQID